MAGSGSENVYEAEDIIKDLLSQNEELVSNTNSLLVEIKEVLTAYSNNDMMGMGADEAIAAIEIYLKELEE